MKFDIDDFDRGAIRRGIHAHFRAHQYFTVGQLLAEFQMSGVVPEGMSRTSFWRLLRSMGFKRHITSRKRYVPKETLEIVSRRVRAIRQLRRYREDSRCIIYLDETWMTTRMTHGIEWVDTTEDILSPNHSRQVPPGEGERLIVIAAGNEAGFIEGSFLVYPCKRTTGDYHGEVNYEIFAKWLMSWLPSLPQPSVLVIDNAPYHSVITDESRCPTSSDRKGIIQEWLRSRGIPFGEELLKPELLALARAHRPPVSYKLDELIRDHGHDVIRLPPGHPELNAIELVWGRMKSVVRSSLRRFSMSELLERVEEARQVVTPSLWASYVRKTHQEEEGYWAFDVGASPEHPPVIVDLESDEEDPDTPESWLHDVEWWGLSDGDSEDEE